MIGLIRIFDGRLILFAATFSVKWCHFAKMMGKQRLVYLPSLA